MTIADKAGILRFSSFYEVICKAEYKEYRNRPYSRVINQENFDRMRAHLVDYYLDVNPENSFVDAAGQIFDCIPTEKQPAVRHSGKAPARLPCPFYENAEANPSREPLMHPEKHDSLGNRAYCPDGTVALRRLSLDELVRFETLQHFFRKRLPRAPTLNDAGEKTEDAAPNIASSTHQYGFNSQPVPNLGGHSILNVWRPAVPNSPGTMSLLQQWYSATPANGFEQTVEAGWQVYPNLYGHFEPVLFTYWTADYYHTTGAYNGSDNNFVLHAGASFAPGMTIAQASSDGGNQIELEISYRYIDGNWWLFVNGTGAQSAVGYYPGSIYGGGPMSTAADQIAYGGETCADSVYPPMGSGAFSSTGYGHAAYQRSITYFPTTDIPPDGVIDSIDDGVMDASLQQWESWPQGYTVTPNFGGLVNWGEYFFVGGPGGTPANPE